MMLLLIIMIWFCISVGLGICVYFEKDQKFGTRHFDIAFYFALFVFLSPVILPIGWLNDLYERICK